MTDDPNRGSARPYLLAKGLEKMRESWRKVPPLDHPLTMTEDLRRVLSHRSERNKIAIAISCRLCAVKDLSIIALLVRNGYLVWLDRTLLPYPINDQTVYIAADVYLLTPKGVAFCDEHGIKPR